MSQKASVKVPVVLLIVLLLAVPIIGVSWWLASEVGLNPFEKKDELGWGEVAVGDQIVTRKLEMSLVNKFSTTNGSGWRVLIYGEDGKTLQEPALTADASGVAKSTRSYESGTKLILECNITNSRIRHRIIVPKMGQADVDAIATNPFDLDIFTIPNGDIVIAVRNSTGPSYSTGGNLSKATFGNTGSLTVMMNAPTDGEGYISSYDEIDGLNWNVVLYAKLWNTSYEYVSVSGWDVQYPKGPAEWFAEKLPDKAITRYKVGNEYYKDETGFVWDGASSFTFNLDITGYTGNYAEIVFYLYAYTDYDYHRARGSFGPDNYALASTFTLNLVQ